MTEHCGKKNESKLYRRERNNHPTNIKFKKVETLNALLLSYNFDIINNY